MTTPDFDQLRRMRIIGRLTVAYLLDVIAIARGDGDPIDTLLASAVIQANVAEITHRAEHQEAFALNDEMPSDDLRRPVSISAIATSLGIPFETVRRRINAMVRDGYCRAVEGGVIVPSEVLADPKYYVDAFRGYERLRAFYYQLRDVGVLGDLPAPVMELSASAFPVRSISRLVGSYVLRVIETMGVHGDIVDGMLLLETFRSNIEHLPQDRPGGVGDAERMPIAVGALAARVGLPAETVRRRVSALVRRGVCIRTPGGLVVPTATLADPRLLAALTRNAGNLQRLFAALSRLGVLRVWDSLSPPVEEAGAA